MRRLGAPLALMVVCAVLGAGAPAIAAPEGLWVRPVDGEVVREFSAPATPYGPGHRGVKFAAAPDTPVRAAGAGTVSFAGSVAGSLHVVVAHPGELRTSYSYLGSIAVHEGERVARGQVVGTTARGTHDPPDSLHLGLRRGDVYLDPMLLFEVRDLTELVRLVPTGGEPRALPWPRATDRQHLVRELTPPDGVAAAALAGGSSGGRGIAGALTGAVVDGVTRLAGVPTTGVDWTTAQLARVGTTALAVAGDLVEHLRDWSARNVPAVHVAQDLVRVGERFAEWVRHRGGCDPSAPPADGSGGSGHSLLAVAGINSATGDDGVTFGLDAEALGYDPDEVHYYSYAPDGGDYDPEATRGDLSEAAERLGAQLRERQRLDPGREVDLIAHSQGGVVVAAFLQHVYDPTDTAYPPIGTIVTLASPHQGAPLATAADDLEGTFVGGSLLDGARRSGLGLPLGSSTRQLAEHSELVRELWARPAHEQLHVTSIGATDDVVVPADRTAVPEATVVTLAVGGLNDHSSIPSDPNALRAVRAALERRDPPCVSFTDGLRGAVMPVVISRVEGTLGDLAASAARGVEPGLP